jgi:uncharacterized protein YdeI (YjbR/CyaY-like superfamily)
MITAADDPLAFETPSQLESWLRLHHGTEHQLWVRVFKKKSGQATVTVDDCIIAAIAWGWIDGQGRSFDEVSYLVRLTPRRPRSNWSKRNCAHAENLIASGQMQPPGMAHVEAARADGRWDQAYAGSADMVIPDDFIEAIEKCPPAKEQFGMLDRRHLFVIYLSLQTAKRFETRTRRIKRFVDQLAKGQKPS